ncbi:NAD(+) synthase [Candidatus Shapirobacteria bacterium]|nr:NAD(+) synthase [Candidatus Shapirobacteria bacterium]
MKVFNPAAQQMTSPQLIALLEKFRVDRGFDTTSYLQKKSALLNEYFRKSGLSGVVIGISGGVDSAVALGIIHYASTQPDSPIKKIIPALVPIYDSGTTNQDKALSRGREVASSMGLTTVEVDVTKVHLLMKETVDNAAEMTGDDWASGQLVSTIRTPAFYYLTSLLNQHGNPALLIGTTNRDEGSYLGFFGKASDGMNDIQIISDIHKSEVYDLAHALKLPQSVLEAIPTGDMFDARTDEEVFGTSYDFVELYENYLCLPTEEQQKIVAGFDKEAADQFTELSARLEKLHSYNAHKYLVGLPAIHLDIYTRLVPGGWKY